jgi:DNA-binding transcriptional regulator YhcF (GntR family)
VIITVDPAAATPPYEQVRGQIERLIGSGELATGARLPTVRQLAGDLGLAVNTVARAYKELEAERLVETRGRHGTFVRGTSGRITDEETGAAALVYARTAQRAGLTMAEALRLVRETW